MKELRNAAQSYAREHYDIDPVEHLAVEKEAAERGLKVVGVWHSHPDRPAVASALDRANAATEWCYLILATARGGVADMRCWHLTQRTSNALAIFTAK